VLSIIKFLVIAYSPAYLWNKPLGHNIGAAGRMDSDQFKPCSMHWRPRLK